MTRIGGQSEGFTLIELAVVAAIIAMVIMGTTVAFRNLTRSDLRSAASRTAGAMRLAFDRATMTGKYIRLVFDFDKGRIWMEGTEERVRLGGGRDALDDEEIKDETAREQDAKLREAQKKQQRKKPLLPFFGGLGAEETEDEGETGQMANQIAAELAASLEADLAPISRARPQFKPLKGLLTKTLTFSSRVSIVGVTTPRELEPITKGRAYVYFFPQGHSEPAIVHFIDRRRGDPPRQDDTFFSVVLHPLTGLARVYPCYYQIPREFGTSDDKRRRTGRDVCAERGGL